ncbi:hypothetical protein SAY86_027439 [Trapa natans]|uniref:Uncharacterized protein n=1 Tax=Trapa natans TaxID=22666 RepID=A0AAN7KQU9_TRANT|nr:hypothetical protein SAY86_027439 [Trapa natans]
MPQHEEDPRGEVQDQDTAARVLKLVYMFDAAFNLIEWIYLQAGRQTGAMDLGQDVS